MIDNENDNNKKNVAFTQHFRERMKQRKIDIDIQDIDINRIKKLPHYIDNGCYKYLDNKNQVIYYVRKYKNVYKLETIIKTNPIQMLRNLCDAHRMLCERVCHPQNCCKFCDKWCFNKICRDHMFGTCQRGNSCKFNHVELPN